MHIRRLPAVNAARNSRIESRQQEITTISRYLKALARELNIPVVVLSQLNRSPEGREGHLPKMSDLRESGSIEQDADVVMLLHREDYYHGGEKDYEPNNIANVIIAKQRNGPTGTADLTFLDKFTRFGNAASFADEPSRLCSRSHPGNAVLISEKQTPASCYRKIAAGVKGKREKTLA